MEIGSRRKGRHLPSSRRLKAAAVKALRSRKSKDVSEKEEKNPEPVLIKTDPLEFVNDVLTKKKTGSLETSKAQVVQHLRTTYTDKRSNKPILVPTDPTPPY